MFKYELMLWLLYSMFIFLFLSKYLNLLIDVLSCGMDLQGLYNKCKVQIAKLHFLISHTTLYTFIRLWQLKSNLNVPNLVYFCRQDYMWIPLGYDTSTFRRDFASISDYILKQRPWILKQTEVLDIRGSAKCISRNLMTNTCVIIYSEIQAVIRSLEATWLYS